MICGACYRKVDDSRSFCPACGSAVFIEPGERPRLPVSAGESAFSAPSPSDRAAVTKVLRPATRSPQRTPQTTRPQRSATPAQPAGCLSAIARLLILVVIFFSIARWLLQIDEVRTLVNSLADGVITDDQMHNASRAVLDHLRGVLDNFR